MNTKSCTDIQQGKELKDAGIRLPAGLFITPKVGGYVVSTEEAANSEPSFGVVELLESIPTTIQNDGSSYDFDFGYAGGYYRCRFVNDEGFDIMGFSKWKDCAEMLKEVWLWLIDGGFVDHDNPRPRKGGWE